jgi:hypothetical protein
MGAHIQVGMLLGYGDELIVMSRLKP